MSPAADDPHRRAYVVVTVDGAADAENVAVLLDRAAAKLRNVGRVDVHAVTFEQADVAAGASSVLTVYYDRVERRRISRD